MTLVVLVVLGLVPAALAVIVMLALSRAQARRRDARYRAAFVDFADEIEAACGAPYVDVTADDITQWEDGYWKAHKDDLYVREALARAFLEGEGHRPARGT